jgi:adenylyltransferase/sulfurtransferase
MTIIPGVTPCLRCVFEASPGPGEVGTCETAGVLGPAVAVVASYQAAEAIKLLAGKKDAINRELLTFDLWINTSRRIKIARLLEARNCPCCKQRKFEWLEGEHGTQTTSLCGRNAVQVSHRVSGRLSFDDLAKQLGVSGQVSFNKFLLKFQLREAGADYEFTVFPDGRAIIKGTDDTEKARTLYAKYIGH